MSKIDELGKQFTVIGDVEQNNMDLFPKLLDRLIVDFSVYLGVPGAVISCPMEGSLILYADEFRDLGKFAGNMRIFALGIRVGKITIRVRLAATVESNGTLCFTIWDKNEHHEVISVLDMDDDLTPLWDLVYSHIQTRIDSAYLPSLMTGSIFDVATIKDADCYNL